jgi:DNA-binding MarR family transcriptional regulator
MTQNRKLVKSIEVLSQEDFYAQHFKILNAILPVALTHTQIEVLSKLMCEPEEYRFSAAAKKKICASLKLSRAGISNYLKQLADKGFLRRESVNGKTRYSINPLILPTSGIQEYEFKLKV